MGISSSTKPQKVQTLTPEQQQFQQLALSLGGQALPAGLDQILQQLDPSKTAELFQQGVAAPQRQAFNEQVLPQLLESSANLGAKGGSAITGQLANASNQLEQGLQQQLAQAQLGQQQAGIGNLLNIGGFGQGAAQAPQFGLQQQGMSPLAQLLLSLTGQGIGAAGTALRGGF